MTKDFFEELSLCSERVLNKVLKYKIDRDQHGVARVFVPEDDDYYKLSAFIEYLEEELSSSEESSNSEYNNQANFQLPDQNETPLDSQNQNTNNNQNHFYGNFELIVNNYAIPYMYGSFREKVKFIEPTIVIIDDDIRNLMNRNDQKYLVVFKVMSWNDENEDDFSLFNQSFYKYIYLCETMTPHFGDTEEGLWKHIEERLNIIMTSKTTERMELFFKIYERYIQENSHEGVRRKTLVECFLEFFKQNKMIVKVRIYLKISNTLKYLIGNRIYSEYSNLTPLGDHCTFDSLKKNYNPCTWKTLVRKFEN